MSKEEIKVHERLKAGLVVGTMCHCDESTEDGEPDPECIDHWQFFIVKDKDAVDETGHVGRGQTLTKSEMDYLASFMESDLTSPWVGCWMQSEGCEPCRGIEGHGDPEW